MPIVEVMKRRLRPTRSQRNPATIATIKLKMLRRPFCRWNIITGGPREANRAYDEKLRVMAGD